MRYVWWVAAAMLAAGCVGATDEGNPGAQSENPEVQDTPDLGKLWVTVVDAELLPVKGATVELIDTEHLVLTDVAGLAKFGGLEPGTYTAAAAKPGYHSVETKGKFADVAAGEVAELTLNLAPIQVVNEDNSYHRSLRFAGHIPCSFHSGLLGYTSYCSRGLAPNGLELPHHPNDNSTAVWEVDSPVVQAIIFEMSWTPTVAALGDELYMRTDQQVSCDVYHCSTRDGLSSGVGGKSPLYEAIYEGSQNNLTKRMGLDPAEYPRTLYTWARAYCDGCSSSNPQNDVMLEQPYVIWASAFYGAAPEVGWSVYDEES